MKRSVNIIGSGPAAMMLACQLDEKKFDVSIYEKNNAPGRKFLVAGDGGFNLTHSEDAEQFLQRYSPADFLKNAFTSFNNNDLREWLKKIGIETYIGSSKRVFPVKGIKPIDVLNAVLSEIKRKNVSLKTNAEWQGWSGQELKINENGTTRNLKSDTTIFALGGSSWKVTGSDGSWTNYFSQKEIRIIPFHASNCAYEIKWKSDFLSLTKGTSLKNISLRCAENEKAGELVITAFGLEGGAIYALSPQIREQLSKNETAEIFIDMKPSLSAGQIREKFSSRGNRSIKKLLIDKLSFDDPKIELLKTMLSKEEFTDAGKLIEKIKALPLVITAAAPIDEAISTVGGISLDEVDENFQLIKLPGHYCIGEMLDWDAPTGGYLLQACFSMGHYLAQHLNSQYYFFD
jgi:hypothetical protein